ncbi:hypothetical protein QBC38DRAFT_427243 [Podospora fimiseda]|uniref:SMP-30/Gluconolactonase/LRE-like region domain-containing protein n=1 Tax=Podospora fimiseda TaxID=252190 RepID=A0AAN6YQY6_9PEZI|nr:hypothetical protein QBC38DRAFT_427243 [Podospora fimiseda]
MILRTLAIYFFTTFFFVKCRAIPPPPATQLSSHLVTQLPNPAWLENIAIRPNGELLLTVLKPQPILYKVIKPWDASPRVEIIYDFSSNTTVALIGITETIHDVFVLVSAASLAGPFTAWTADFKGKSSPQVTKLTHLNGAKLPNGVTSLPGCPNRVLIADSFAGLVWSLDTITQKFEIAVQVPEMSPPPNSTAQGAVGINGIKMYKGYLYWTNSMLATVYRIKIKPDGTAERSSKAEIVAHFPVSFLDDFVINDHGILFAMASYENQIWATSSQPGGSVTLVIGQKDQPTVSGITSGEFGRTRQDGKSLYAVTSGAGTDGKITDGLGGKVVAVDTKHFNL